MAAQIQMGATEIQQEMMLRVRAPKKSTFKSTVNQYSACGLKDDTANLQLLFISSNGGRLKYNYEGPGQTTTPPLLCRLTVGLSRTNLLVSVAARLFTGLICSSHCFDVLGVSRRASNSPTRLRERVAE